MKTEITLKDFISAEIKKYKIEDTQINRKNIRNKLDNLVKSNYKFKDTWKKLPKQTSGYHARLLTSDFCKKLDLEAKDYLEKYAQKHLDPQLKKANLSASIANPIKRKEIEKILDKYQNKDALEVLQMFDTFNIDMNYLLLKLIFSKLFPDKEINTFAIQKDLATLLQFSLNKTTKKAYDTAFVHLQNLENYLYSKKDNSTYDPKNPYFFFDIRNPYYLIKMKEIK